MKLARLAGQTSQVVEIFVQDSSKTDGSGLTGLVFNTASLVASYSRTKGARVAVTLVTQTVTGAYSSGGFVEIDATNMPGVYRLDIPDAALASGADSVIVMLKGATNMAPVVLEIDLWAADPQNATSLGLSRLDAAITSRMATFTLPTNFSALSIDASGRVDIGKWIGVAPNALVQGKVDAATPIRSGTAQAGAAGTITLDAGASATTDFYKGTWILLVSGTGSGQVRLCTAFNGGTKVASVAPNWATAPDATSVFIVIPAAGLDVELWVASAPSALIAGRVDANAQVVGDKTGYALTQAFPTNFSSLVIDASGRVDLSKVLGVAINALIAGRLDVNVGVNSDKTGYQLDATGSAALTEAYRANGATGTIAQLLYEILAHLGESSNAGTTKTLKKLDHATTAETFTYDSATAPTSVTRAT